MTLRVARQGAEFGIKIGWLGVAALLAVVAGCGTDPGTTPTSVPDPGAPTEPGEPESVQLERQRVLSLLDEVAGVDPAGLTERYPAAFAETPSYRAESLQGLDLIQASSLALNATELDALTAKGFVVSDRLSFPSFAYGYQNIYGDDLPVYVSADSILDAIHRSYDDILQSLELELLSAELSDQLGGMRTRLGSGVGAELGTGAVRDADVFLTVAASLATGELQQANAGGDQALIDELVKAAEAHDGWQQPTLFGVRRDEDFSQYEPRGHYADEPVLQRYFRAMMWLGRIDFRLLETQSDGTRVFRRRQLEGMLLLNELVDAQLKPHFQSIDDTLQAFVGEPDYMVLSQVQGLLDALGVGSAAEVADVPDDSIVAAILSGGFGTQRISSHIMINGLDGAGTLPLSASFALMGQRYVVDSHVFSNVVFDRVANGAVKRMMPSPLDVGFAALANNQAAQLLAPELESYEYAPDLGAMRVLVDDHPREFWQKNLYNLWLDSLRALAPTAEVSVELPAVAQSEPWGRRLLGAQLASWAQLRHDTILYAKQSYTGGIECEFPDAYVDPYPEVYARIQAYGELGESLVQSLAIPRNPALKKLLGEHFQKVASVARTLGEIAEHQRSGTELTPEMMSFINQAVVLDQGCGDPSLRAGWYAQLFFNTETAPDYDPTIADVHTQPTDEAGSPVGRVLHVATGMPRLMVVAVDTCTGPRAYAGLSSSYFEKTTEQFERLNDEDWANSIRSANPDDVSWLSEVVTRSEGPRPATPESE
jgi:hypothetical protein